MNMWTQYDAEQMYTHIYHAHFADDPRLERVDPSWENNVDVNGIPTRIDIGSDSRYYNYHHNLGKHDPIREQVHDTSAREAMWLLNIGMLDPMDYFRGHGAAKDRIRRYCRFLTGCLRHKASTKYRPQSKVTKRGYGFGFRANNQGYYKIEDWLALGDPSNRSHEAVRYMRPAQDVEWDLQWLLSLIAWNDDPQYNPEATPNLNDKNKARIVVGVIFDKERRADFRD